MGKKKSANKRTTTTTPTAPPASNGGTSDLTISPTASTFAKDEKDSSEPAQDEINATNSTEESSPGNAATTMMDAPAAPLSKSQKKKARKAAAAALANGDTTPQEPVATEEVDTPTTPVESSEANTNMTKSDSDEPETSKSVEDTRTPEPEHDLEGDAWGLNEDEPAVADHDVTKPAADEAPAPSAQDSSSADGVKATTEEPKSEDAIPKDKEILSDDQAPESVPPPPRGEAPSDAVPNSSNASPSLDASDPQTKNDPVIPSEEVAVEGNPLNADTTDPNGTFNCEPMELPPRPSDDDNTPLAQIAGRKKPIVDTNLASNGLGDGGGNKQTPSSAGGNLGSVQSESNSNASGAGVFSNSPSRPDALSVSPSTPAAPARGPAAVGFGSSAPPQNPTTTSSFGFGFGSPQKTTPKTASGMSWSPSPASAPSKPAKSSGWGWGNLASKAREKFEQVINDEPSHAPATSSHPPAAAPPAPPARSPSVERRPPSPVGPANSNSNPNATPTSPTTRPTKGMTDFQLRMAALRKKAVTGGNKDSTPEPTAETPKPTSSVLPPADSGSSPISPSQSTQSHIQSQPLPLPLPPSTSVPTEQTAPQTPNQAKVTSEISPLPRESTAETGKVGKLIAKFDHSEAPISSKTATTGLRLHTEPVVPDGRSSAPPVTKLESIESETERPQLADMRSVSAPGPRTPITSASPKTPGSFNFGPGLGTSGRFNRGGFTFGGGGLGGFRPGHAPSPMSTPIGEKNEAKFKSQQDLDELSSVVEGSEPTDLDSQVGESEPQDLDSLVDDSGVDALANIPINIDVDSPAIPTTFNTPAPDVAPVPDVAPSVANPWDRPSIVTTQDPPASDLEVTAPLPSPTKSEFEPEVAISDDKTIADRSDIADVEPEPVPVLKDEPQVESPVASEPAVTPVAERPTKPFTVEEPAAALVTEDPVTAPVVDEPVVAPVVDESIVKPILHDEAPAPESTEPVVISEPQVNEPPPELSTEETPESPVESAVEPVVEVTTEPTPEPAPEPAPEPHAESIVEPLPETPVEQMPEPVESGPKSPEPVPVPSIEPTSEPAPEPATLAFTSEPPTEPSSQPLPPSPIEPAVFEAAPATPIEAPVEKPAPPKLAVDVPLVDDSLKLKSPLPPTPATPVTPATPATPAKKKKKKGKKGNATASEPAPVIPETISEPSPESEPASRSEPVSMSEPAPPSVPEAGPAKPKVEPIRVETRAESVIPTPVEPEVESMPEPVEPTPAVEVSSTPEVPKEPESAPEVVEDAKPKEETASSTKSKKPKKKKRKSSTAPEGTSPTDDVPPTPIEAEQQEPMIVEVAEPTIAELVVVEPVVMEPEVVKPAEVEPEVIEPEIVEPVPVEPAMVEPIVVESVVAEPVVEATPSGAIEESTKNEDNRTAVPDEGFETPKVAPQELPELTPERVEVSAESPVVEAPIETIIVPSAEPAPEPILISLSPEVLPEATPVPEAQPELGSKPAVELIVEPAADLIVESVITPLVEVVAETPVEPAHESVPELLIERATEPIADPAIAPPAEEFIVEVAPVVESVPEPEAPPSTEPVFELAVSPVVEGPKEELPIPEVKVDLPSSKTSRKKNKKKNAGKAAAAAEEPEPSPANEEPVVEVARPEIPIASTVEEHKINEEIAVTPSPTTPKKKKGKKAKATSVIPTPVEEQAPVLPAEDPIALVEAPQPEMEDAPAVVVTSQVEPLESPIPAEASPKIEVLELADDQGAEAASTISVVQPHLDIVTPIQPTPLAIELAPIESVPEALSEPEPVPVLVDLPQSPVTSVRSVSSPLPINPSPAPEETFLATRESSPPPRSVTPNTDKHDETLDQEVPQIPIISIPNPIHPTSEHVISAGVTTNPSASPVSDSASRFSKGIGLFGRGGSIVSQESQPLRRTRSISSITSIDTDSPPTTEMAKMQSVMPPLISVPIPSPVATVSPHLDPAITQPSAQPAPEHKPKATIVETPVPSTATNDLPTNDVSPKLDTTTKPSPPRILDGFSPLRWFGFGGAPSPLAESKPVEVKPGEAKPVEVKPIELKPVEVKSVEIKPVEAKPIEVKPIEVRQVDVKLVEANPTEIKLVEGKPIVVEPIEAKPAESRPATAKPMRTPAAILSPSPKVTEDRERQPKVTLVPIRKAASPSSPESPAVEKTAWSRWPHQPPVVTSIPPVKPRVPLARDSIPVPMRHDSQTAPSRPVRLPPVSTMPAIIPIAPIAAVSPSTPARADSRHTRRSHRTSDTTVPVPPTPVSAQDTSPNEEKKERPAKRPSTTRVTSPTPNAPAVVFQSPRSSEDSLPAYTPQALNIDSDPKPVPRGILKQRLTPPATPPDEETPAANPVHAIPHMSRFEFTNLRNAPAYDDWGHAPSTRKDVLSNTGVPQSRETQPPSATVPPPSSRSRTTGDSNHRSRSKHSHKEPGSVPNKVNRPRTPSPLRESKTALKTTITPPKPNLVPVLNEKIIRTKAPKPAKISTTRTAGDVYIQPLTSPILLTSENYGARQPENSVYQYDGISSSESLSPATRKAIFDILQKQVAPEVFPILARPSFDGKRMLYAQRRLKVSSRQEFSVELPVDGQEPRVYIVQLKRVAVITPQIVSAFH